MRFESQAAAAELLVERRAKELGDLAPAYEEGKAKLAEAEANIEAKKKAVGEKAYKKFAGTAAGKAMTAARTAANKQLQLKDESGETLSKRRVSAGT